MIHIAFGFNENYTMPTGVVMLSICMNTPGPICFHALIDPDVTGTSRKQMEDMAASFGNQIAFYTIAPELFKGAYLNPIFTLSTYNRLLIPEILPAEVKKAIYLDCDTITVNSLQPLWDEELADDEPLGMAYDSGTSDVRHLNNLDIPLSQRYFNSGVLLMNLDCWRREHLCEKCINLVATNDFPYVDQDAINILLGHRVHHLHLRYNLQYPFLTVDEKEWMIEKSIYTPEAFEAIKAPVIIHYSGHFKPWYTDCEIPQYWMKYKALSPWKDVPLIQRHTNMGFHLQVDGVVTTDIEAADSIVAPLLAIIMNMSIKHHRLFMLFRKMLWTIARKRHLIED